MVTIKSSLDRENLVLNFLFSLIVPASPYFIIILARRVAFHGNQYC
jgi:hypothetical protein